MEGLFRTEAGAPLALIGQPDMEKRRLDNPLEVPRALSLMALAAVELWRGRLFARRKLLWVLMLMAPFPYVANTAGWITAEAGR